MSYAMAGGVAPGIDNGLMYGYYEGEITGLPANQVITDP